MLYAVIIIALILYGSFSIMPDTWKIMPEFICQGDKIMSVGFYSCIIAAIIAILVALFKYWDRLYYAILTYFIICVIAIGIN